MEKIILIVEDDAKSRKLVRDLLQVIGYETIEAVDGKQGIHMARDKQPDLILMDIQMPVMDGIEAAKILKADEKTKTIPVVAMTAYAMKEDEEKIRQSGFDGYFTKPIDTQVFLKKIGTYFTNSQPG